MTDLTAEQRLNHFWTIYRKVGSSDNLELFKQEVRTCRFCNRDETNVPFNMIAHACPELLGENNLVYLEECDNCNKEFSKYESHLSKLFLPYLTMAGIKGKHKVPDFHSRTENGDEKTRTIVRFDEDGRRAITIGVLDDYILDEASRQVSIRFRLPPYKPWYVYKALVKIAASILPKEYIGKHIAIFEWLGNAKGIGCLPKAIVTMLHDKKFTRPIAEVYEAKSIFCDKDLYPELCLVLNFGNLVIQTFLPFPKYINRESVSGFNLSLPIYPAFVHNITKEHRGQNEPIPLDLRVVEMNLSEKHSCIRDEVISFSFESLQRSTL